MKNKFKKSKIIVPALALITATTVASVTGTVAWFTANRAITVDASNFVATKLESNLTVETEAGNGTYTSDNATGITTTTQTADNKTTNNKLTHGSYNAQNAAAGSLYVAKVSDDGTKVDSFTDLGKEEDALDEGVTTSSNNWLARSIAGDSETNNIWYGLSWKMTFTLDSTSNTTDYLLLDPAGSSFTDNSSKDNTTLNGFRIAFMTTDSFFVLGKDSTVTHCPATITNNEDVSQTISYANYTVGTDYQVVGASVTKASDEYSDAQSTALALNKYNLGEIDATNGLTVTCVAWYEGSDTAVADKNSSGDINMSNITATLSFYTRGIIAA